LLHRHIHNQTGKSIGKTQMDKTITHNLTKIIDLQQYTQF